MLERKDGQFRGSYGAALNIELKEVSEDGEFEGYGSIFGNQDRGRDIVRAGAFTESLSRNPAPRVKMLWQHNPSEPIGKWLEMREDSKGLYVKGKLLTNIQRAAEILELIREGVVEGLSIGYRTQDYEWDEKERVRTLTKVELWEVSVVTFPMNTLAGINLVKSAFDYDERNFERYLTRDAGYSAKHAKAIIANGYPPSLKAARDAGGRDDADALARALREARANFA